MNDIDTAIKEHLRTYRRENKRRQRQGWKERGLCLRCGRREATGTTTLCEPCVEKHKLACQRAYQKRLALRTPLGDRQETLLEAD